MNSQILAADPALPQRDHLLDENLMAPYLAQVVGPNEEIQQCRRLRTKYCVGTSLRVLYELTDQHHSYRVAARAFPATHDARRPSSTAGIHVDELNTTFWKFPDDRKIKNVSVVVQIPPELAEIAGRQWVRSRVVGHAPEKSLTAQCLTDDGSALAYAKVYAGDEGQQVFNVYNHVNAALQSCELDLQVPRALSYSQTHHVLLLESVEGVPLAALPYGSRERSLFNLGIALKTLHGIKPPSSVSRFDRLTPENLERAATTISYVRPDVATIVQRLTARLIAQHKHFSAGEEVLLHGDVHPKNVLLNRQGLFLLDLDQAALGVAALDVASVIASLYHDACIDSVTLRECSSLVDAFLFGYDLRGRSITTGSLRWHVAATLLGERALRAITRIRPESLKKLPQILTTAEAVMENVSEK